MCCIMEFLKGYLETVRVCRAVHRVDFRFFIASNFRKTLKLSRALYQFLMKLKFFPLISHLCRSYIKVSCYYQVFSLYQNCNHLIAISYINLIAINPSIVYYFLIKLARSNNNLKILLDSIAKTLIAIGNFLLLLTLFIYIFALLGMS